jgi:hypothetical protein
MLNPSGIENTRICNTHGLVVLHGTKQDFPKYFLFAIVIIQTKETFHEVGPMVIFFIELHAD